MKGNTANVGAYSELIACAWLLEQGYQVFRNVSPSGPYDIIAIKGPEELRVNVRTIRFSMRTGSYPRVKWKAPLADVQFLYVDPDMRRCAFSIEKL